MEEELLLINSYSLSTIYVGHCNIKFISNVASNVIGEAKYTYKRIYKWTAT